MHHKADVEEVLVGFPIVDVRSLTYDFTYAYIP